MKPLRQYFCMVKCFFVILQNEIYDFFLEFSFLALLEVKRLKKEKCVFLGATNVFICFICSAV